MIYFALSSNGLLHNLGDHGDFDSADCCAEDMQLNAFWLFDEFSAKSYTDFINQTLNTTESTL